MASLYASQPATTLELLWPSDNVWYMFQSDASRMPSIVIPHHSTPSSIALNQQTSHSPFLKAPPNASLPLQTLAQRTPWWGTSSVIGAAPEGRNTMVDTMVGHKARLLTPVTQKYNGWLRVRLVPAAVTHKMSNVKKDKKQKQKTKNRKKKETAATKKSHLASSTIACWF